MKHSEVLAKTVSTFMRCENEELVNITEAYNILTDINNNIRVLDTDVIALKINYARKMLIKAMVGE